MLNNPLLETIAESNLDIQFVPESKIYIGDSFNDSGRRLSNEDSRRTTIQVQPPRELPREDEPTKGKSVRISPLKQTETFDSVNPPPVDPKKLAKQRKAEQKLKESSIVTNKINFKVGEVFRNGVNSGYRSSITGIKPK